MSVGVLGRMLTLVGLTCGLLALALPALPGERYIDDGTAAAFLLVVLALSSWYPAEVGPPALGAGLGAAAFGFFLVYPALFAFDGLGNLDAGAWLGLCTALIPVGVLLAEREPALGGARSRLDVKDPRVLVSLVAVALLIGGIWLPVADGRGVSFWNVSFSGHALGLLILLLALLNAVLIVAAPRLPLTRVTVAAATFGLVEAVVVGAAFEDLGTLGSGVWLEACAGLLLLVGTVWSAPVRDSYEAAPVSLSQSPR